LEFFNVFGERVTLLQRDYSDPFSPASFSRRTKGLKIRERRRETFPFITRKERSN